MQRNVEKPPETFIPIGKIADEIVRKIAIRVVKAQVAVPVKRMGGRT